MTGESKYLTREEVRQHNKRGDQWVIIENKVYDVSNWAVKHPGGPNVLNHYAGEDATDAWKAFHINTDLVRKYMKPLHIGDVEHHEAQIEQDFRCLRKVLEDGGYFTANRLFFAAVLIHIIVLEMLGYLIIRYMGLSWSSVLFSAFVLTVMQAQAGWHQHDLGHLSVLPSSKWNHVLHKFVIGVTKAASADWWNFRHFQHHAKPNVVMKDPDITIPYMFLFGDTMPSVWGAKKRGVMPYNLQHIYFFFTFPPLLLPLYFHYENIHFAIKKGSYVDVLCTLLFFAKHFYLYGPLMGYLGAFGFYMFVRFLESHWFVWVTQMNHIPMEVEKEQNKDWVSMQLAATCNVEGSLFNDWFTGHLNYQIEHHLFPTMPRHNYAKVAPMVKSLCKKHGLNYEVKPLMTAFKDIIFSLEKSGQIWLEAYNLA